MMDDDQKLHNAITSLAHTFCDAVMKDYDNIISVDNPKMFNNTVVCCASLINNMLVDDQVSKLMIRVFNSIVVTLKNVKVSVRTWYGSIFIFAGS